jgi:hypothetical protein
MRTGEFRVVEFLGASLATAHRGRERWPELSAAVAELNLSRVGSAAQWVAGGQRKQVRPARAK